MIFDVFGRKALEIVTLTAGENSCWNFLRISRSKNKNHSFRWFFQCLQKRVKCIGGQHMYFVNDINLIKTVYRRVLHLLPQLANFFNTAVRCSVYFNYIKRISLGNTNTLWTFTTKISRWPFNAVQS